jgi:hypothetical protein
MAKNKNNGIDATYGSNTNDGSRLSGVTDTARDKLSDLSSTTSSTVSNSPLIALGAGAAVGAVLAAVLPSTQRERELLAPIGNKITTAGNGAVDRARDMSRQKFDEMAGDKVREFFGVTSGGSSNS